MSLQAQVLAEQDLYGKENKSRPVTNLLQEQLQASAGDGMLGEMVLWSGLAG